MCSTADRRLVTQAFRFELDPSRAQGVLLAKSVGVSRYVYNWGLAESQRAYELTGKRPRLAELKRRLVHLKKTECPWLYEVSAHIGQQALFDLDRAFERFFGDVKGEGPKSGFPRFKKKSGRDSLALSVNDAGLGEFLRQLAYKCDWYGSTLVAADRFFPSTQLCSGCGSLNEKVKGFDGLTRRRFECDACGLSLDRDENAAINLRAHGLHQLGIVPLPEGLREVTPVREEGSAPRRSETGLAEAGSESSSHVRRDPQKRSERRAGDGLT